jgi:hypothetical protein
MDRHGSMALDEGFDLERFGNRHKNNPTFKM